MRLVFKKGQKIVMIGDSITDCGRSQEELGWGYVRIVASLLGGRYPKLGLSFVNKGIGGNTVFDLQTRWEEDVMKEGPDWVSISVGLNDMHRILHKYERGVDVEEFEEVYRGLIEKTQKAGIKVILMETTGIGAPGSKDNRKLVAYNEVIRKLAKEFGTILVRENRAWTKAMKGTPGMKWTLDGVHPVAAGHGLMAKVWLEAVGFRW